jgi:H+/gluconate symporter-like permease
MVLKSRYFQIGSIVLGTLLIVILLASIVAYIYYRRSLKKKQSQPKDLEASPVKDMFAPQMCTFSRSPSASLVLIAAIVPCAAYSSASIANTIAIPAIEEHAAPPGKDEDGDALDHFTPEDLRQFDPSPSHSFCDRSRCLG